MISAVILTKNEEKNIEKCLKSLSWCDEITVVDDFSTDKTITQIKNLKCKSQNYNVKFKIFKRNLGGDFAAQRNFGLEKAKNDWVFFVDADEEISAELSAEIKFKIQNEKFKIYSGFYLKRRDRFLGRWLKFGETASVSLLRLAKKEAGRWRGKVHEVWRVKGKIKVLKNPLLHQRKMTIFDFLDRINHYSTIRSSQLFDQSKKTNIFLIIAFPTAKFIQNYFFRLGFLDGFPGFALAFFMSLHSLLARGKLYMLWNQK